MVGSCGITKRPSGRRPTIATACRRAWPARSGESPSMEETKQDLPILEFEHPDAWEQWLQENHASSPGVWLKLAKKSAPRPTVTYAGALDVALAYGWIDSQKARYDEDFSLQRFT